MISSFHSPFHLSSQNGSRCRRTLPYFKGQADIVELLLSSPSIAVNDNDNLGRTLLMLACSVITKASVKLVSSLLSHNADTNHKDLSGKSVALVAAGASGLHSDVCEVVKLLFAHGADFQLADQSGLTPLMAALTQGNNEVVSFLLSKGIFVNSAALPESGQPNVLHKHFDLAAMSNINDFWSSICSFAAPSDILHLLTSRVAITGLTPLFHIITKCSITENGCRPGATPTTDKQGNIIPPSPVTANSASLLNSLLNSCSLLGYDFATQIEATPDSSTLPLTTLAEIVSHNQVLKAISNTFDTCHSHDEVTFSFELAPAFQISRAGCSILHILAESQQNIPVIEYILQNISVNVSFAIIRKE